MNRAFKKIYYEENLPKDTEIVIADDATQSVSHRAYLIELSKLPRVTVIINYGFHGAFYNKLHGFMMARGKYIMSSDDDDVIDTGYYTEMINHIDESYDIIYSIDAAYTHKKFGSIEEMITCFHNFYNLAFRKELIMSIEYPKEIPIIRDDAPLIIPIYMKTDMSRIRAYDNRYKYKIDNKLCDSMYKHKHQSGLYAEQDSVKNGMNFLISYAEKHNQMHYIPSIKAAYIGYITEKFN